MSFRAQKTGKILRDMGKSFVGSNAEIEVELKEEQRTGDQVEVQFTTSTSLRRSVEAIGQRV